VKSEKDLPRTACGYAKTRFMSGYKMTMKRDEAPSKMLQHHFIAEMIRLIDEGSPTCTYSVG
jgi:hypothetical protein